MEKLTKALMTDETGQAIVTKLIALSGQMHELAMATRGSAILFESESDIWRKLQNMLNSGSTRIFLNCFIQ